MKYLDENNKDGQRKVAFSAADLSSTSSRNADQCYGQFLFDTLRTSVLYLDQWGRIRSANETAKKLFDNHFLSGKTALEVLGCWGNPIHVHQEILSVARTGHSVTGLIEKIIIDNQERWFQTDKIAVKNAEHGFNGVVFTLDDITPLKQHQINLAKSETSYRAFVENSQDAIWRLDLNPPVALLTEDGLRLDHKDCISKIRERAVVGDCNHIFNTSYDVSSKIRFNGILLKDISFNNAIINLDEFVANDFRLNDFEMICESHSGEHKYLQISAQGIVEDNCLVGIWGITKDRTESRQYIERLEYRNTHDILTGLPNRALLQSSVEHAIRYLQKGKKLVLMIIDLDSFKEINDTLGHGAGDKIIQGIGARLLKHLEGVSSTVARLGGDEFAILLSEVKDLDEATSIGNDLLNTIRQYFYIDDIEVEVRASIGAVVYPDQADDFSTLLRYADVAMYCAKEDMSGVVFYHPDKDAHSPKRLSLMSELGKAIRNNHLALHFQPKISLDDQRIVGVEVLARWTHPTMGFISPAEFVPIAEMTDLINDMTRWILDESLRQVSEWRQRKLNISVAVNISARNLQQEDFCDMVRSLLQKHDVPASFLELEITEGTIMKNTEKTLLILNELNDMGVDLSIDDFGTGYSSLAYLKRLPVKRLKIDYSFIINMLNDEQDQIIVNSTINMAHNLGLLVIAEGVENQDIMLTLGEMKCEQAQGFHIARPMPANDLEKWCANY